MGKLTVVDHQRAAGLRRAIGLILVAGLCVSAVTFYRDAELPRQPRTQRSARLQPRRRRRPHRSPLLRLPRSRRNCRRALVPLNRAFCSWPPRCTTVASMSPRSCSSTHRPLRSGSVPSKLALAGRAFAKAKPVASQIQVSAGDQPVLVPGGRVNQRTNLALAVPAKRIELRYNLRGITVRSIPSRAGRALAAISPLVEGVPKTLPVALRISGSTVINIGCPVLRLREQACSAGRPPRLRVNRKLPWRNAVIVVQFDLPRPQ